MQNMNISLPDPVKQYVDGQVKSGGYSDASEYIGCLIREDEKRRAHAHLEALLLEGLEGEEQTFTPSAWQGIRQNAAAEFQARKTSN